MKMKKFLALALCGTMVFSTLTGCSKEDDSSSNETTASEAPLSGNVKTGGSTSVEKVMTALIYQFGEDNRDVTIDYEMNGSGDGIKNTISGLYEIGHSSRELKTDGTEDGLDAVAYAIDGIAVVLHKDNKVENLTPEQIKDIYTGKITNWKDVGGEDKLITVVTREASSGTRGAFCEIIGLDKTDMPETNILESATTCDNTGAIQTTVSGNDAAIGYMSFSDVDTSKVKTIQYDGVEISTDTLKDSSYKLKREFYLVTKKDAKLSAPAQAFIDYILSADGQKIVSDNKLLPIK